MNLTMRELANVKFIEFGCCPSDAWKMNYEKTS